MPMTEKEKLQKTQNLVIYRSLFLCEGRIRIQVSKMLRPDPRYFYLNPQEVCSVLPVPAESRSTARWVKTTSRL